MGIRKIREMGEELLRKTSKPVASMDLRTRLLIRDMFDTMYEAGGVGLAAPQVGILKRIFVIDCTEDGSGKRVFVNPEILETQGEQTDYEGCLSVPGKHAQVCRAMKVKVRAFDENMKEFTLETEGLEARCILHENDHLDGILYVDKACGEITDVKDEE